MKNWKTTLSGGLTAVAGFVAFSPQFFGKWPIIIELAKYLMAGGFVAMGLAGKDHDMTGGTRTEPGTGDKASAANV